MDDSCFVVFLDVDGVLNTDNMNMPICIKLLENFTRMQKKYNFSVVLSSTWRSFPHSKNLITKILASRGVAIRSVTPELPNGATKWQQNRAREILMWVAANKPCGWIAVDDLPLRLPFGNFVKTNPRIGFDAIRAEELEHKLVKQVHRS